MGRKAEIELEYQHYIQAPPAPLPALYQQACANDDVTIKSWYDIWLKQIRSNKKRFGSFKDHGIGQLVGKFKNQPAVIAGSGPSLKLNSHLLKERDGIPLVSCLHNFHHFEDQEIAPDYYMTLDAGPVVLEEISEGGKRDSNEYWSLTRDRTLVAYIGSPPELFDRWKGKVYLFNAPVPDDKFTRERDEVEVFNSMISSGGNVLGGCFYLARGVLGCNPIAFIGADFSFSYDKKFHAWPSKYDKDLGHVLKVIDVFGNRVSTWQSYHNFKSWFDYVANVVPGIYFNCTEGGTFGAYPEGNIMAVRQAELSQFLRMCRMHEEIANYGLLNPEIESKEVRILV